MVALIKNLFSDTFFKRYLAYFSGSMVVAVLNYAFHPLMAQLLVPAEFGELQAFLALIAQTAILFGVFSVIAVNITANTEDENDRNSILSKLQKIALIFVGVIVVGLLLFITSVQSFFKFGSPYPLIALAVAISLSAFVAFRNGYLQGSGSFAQLSIGGVIGAASKLLLGVSLVTVGFGVGGAIWGVVLSSLIALSYLYSITKGSLNLDRKSNIHTLEKGSIRKELKYGILVFFTTGLVTLLFTSDVLIIKRFFSPEEAGLYSGISAIAKILFFAVAPVAAVLLSAVKIKNTHSENTKILLKSLGVAFFIGGVGLFTFYTYYDIIIRVMIGEAYVSFAHLLPQVTVVMFFAAILNILTFYFLALRRYFLILPALIGMTGIVMLLLFGNKGIEVVLSNLLSIIILCVSILIIIYAKDHFNNRPRI